MKSVQKRGIRRHANLGFAFVAFILAISYVFKGLLLVASIHLGMEMAEFSPDWAPIRLDVAYGALFFSVVLLIFNIVLLKVLLREKYIEFEHSSKSTGFSIFLVGASIILAVLVLYMRVLAGAVMGMEPPDIPWYRGTLVYRAQQYLVPALFLLVLNLSLRLGSNVLRNFSILGFFVFMVIGSGISGSKAGVFFYFLFIGLFYWIYRGGFKFNFTLVFVAAILLIFSFIAGNQVRSYLLTGVSSNEWIELMSGNVVTPTLQSTLHIFMRLTGIEGMAIYCSVFTCGLFDFSNLEVFLEGRVGEFYTRDIIGVVNPFDFRAPGLVGGAVIGLGYIGAFLFVLLFTFSWAVCAQVLGRLSATPVPLVSLHVGLIVFAIEGVLVWRDLIVLAVAVFTVLSLDRIFFRKH